MSKALRKLKKLRGRSLDELRVRGRQALAAYAERRGLSAQARLPTDAEFFASLAATPGAGEPRRAEGLLEHFRRRTAPRFFASFDDRAKTVGELRRRFGAETLARTVECAERVREGRFDLLGQRDLSFGSPVDWHFEPRTGRRAPLRHWSRIDFLEAEVAGDKKFTWELNRHQYFLTLGRAYWYTGDERYAETFAEHLSAWADANPPKLGINWASSLEVSFRLISWLWALHFFRDSPRLRPELFLRALKLLSAHARHLETYLSTYFSPNTHLTGEALGLFYAGTLLPELRGAARWRATGRGILLAQLDRHVLADGVYFEQSSYYQRYTADFYTHLRVLARANAAVGGAQREEEAGEKLDAKLRALLDHLMFITRPDGTTPFLGDDDGGRLVTLDERGADDFRAALSTGAALFGRGDYKLVAGELAEETLWLLGPAAARAFDELEARPPAETSRAFRDGGYYVMRDGWGRDANYLLVDCGPHGADNCGHAHADALSLELAAGGRTLLVDPGTYTYTASLEERNAFRDSSAHNTLTVDGESSSVPGTAFTWRHVAQATARRWLARPRFDLFEGEHDGYMRLAAPALHRRGVFFLKGEYWAVRDRVVTEGPHRYELRFHFAAGAEASIEDERGVAAGARGRAAASARAPGLGLHFFGSAGGGTRARAEEGWVSRCYGGRDAAAVAVFSAEGRGAQEFVTFLLPAGKHGAREVREVEAVGGRAFEIGASGGARDVLLLPSAAGGRVETARFSSDFAWAWARLAGDGAGLCELALVDGRRFEAGGREVVRAGAGGLEFCIARLADGEWVVETGGAGRGFDFWPPPAASSAEEAHEIGAEGQKAREVRPPAGA